jgi:hypothetical protein
MARIAKTQPATPEQVSVLTELGLDRVMAENLSYLHALKEIQRRYELRKKELAHARLRRRIDAHTQLRKPRQKSRSFMKE